MTPNSVGRSTRFLVVLGLLAVLLAGCSSPPTTAVAPPVPTSTADARISYPGAPSTGRSAAPSTPIAEVSAYFPANGWRTSSPEDQGTDSQTLAQMLTAIEQQQLNLHSLLIIRNGYLVSENYFGSYQPDTRHELYSCTKSFIATLIGIALDKGYLTGRDQRIVDFFPERAFAHLDQQKVAMTLDDLLTMRSGLDWKEGDAAIRAMYLSPDWVNAVLDEPMIAAAGSRFNYCSGCSHVLSAILQQAANMNPRDFADQHLFKPLGITNVNWDTAADGTPIGGWGLQLTPRDMAKLGYLYLHQGQWEGQQIVSAEWVKDATRTHTETDADLGYGYQWWTYPSLVAYTALGRGGQTIFVIPKLDLIIVTTAGLDNNDPIYQLIEQYIMPAVRDSL